MTTDQHHSGAQGPDGYDVLVVGGTGVDTIVRVDELRVPPGDSVFVEPLRDYVGHTGNGVALGWHALGLRTKFIDFLGDDPQGRMVLEHYARQGLDFAHLVSPHGTPRAVNLVDAKGRRFSFYDGRHPEDLRLPRDFYLPHLERSAHVHLSIIGHNQDMYDDIHRLGVTSSTDLHDWDGHNPHHRHYALRSDYVFLSAAAVHDRLETVLRSIVGEGRARFVVATDGANGCYLLERGADTVRHFPAVRPERPVVDSNGAGDAFVTAFLHAYFERRPFEDCVLAGSVAGAFVCGSVGTHTEFIGLPELRAASARAAASR
ncbi:carbohydrate kinase family protein [Streptomyces albofaciens JCM 4342]|uniref:carbohydrate kinase family protein n=1 Tax=Streptomyces albofaciens TaxID=66866 RepID=UPI00123A788B|nr:PfkB family carbohydrate kinase [Streptomyces albofaciens]KAA6223950.1 carbohydrate kinase family protein [Streptomyces albofaciens JCM 4342]